MDENERLLVQRMIATAIDHPSVYMNGASRDSMRKADNIIRYLERSKRLNATTCGHSGWTDFKLHGSYCPDCDTILPFEQKDPSKA